jgi:hypothetical protein
MGNAIGAYLYSSLGSARQCRIQSADLEAILSHVGKLWGTPP